METGTGTHDSPELLLRFGRRLYYTLLHNKYRKSAAARTSCRTARWRVSTSTTKYDEAEAIDSALVGRAKIEALNVADRQIDIAWLAEGDKIDGQMERLQTQHRPYPASRRHTGRQGAVDGILPYLPVRHRRDPGRLHA